MCDAMSLVSAYGSIQAGKADAITARSKADFRTAQLEVAAMLATASAREEEGVLRREFADVLRRNAAAQAITGLDSESFAAVRKGNQEDRNRGIRTIGRNLRSRKAAIRADIAATQIDGELEAKAAKWGGISEAVDTLSQSVKRFKENRKPDQSLGNYFAQSMGF